MCLVAGYGRCGSEHVGACADCESGRRAARAEARENERVTLVQEQVAERGEWLGHSLSLSLFTTIEVVCVCVEGLASLSLYNH